jgi:type II secretory ATPase GspE/PulE/Tfp pilus assembly ATPase PilB-like protein
MTNVSDVNQEIYAMSRMDEEKQSQSIAAINQLPYVYLVNYPMLADILYLIRPEQANKYHVVAYLKSGDNLHVATPNPHNPELLEFLKTMFLAVRLKPVLHVCSDTSFRYLYQLYTTFQEDAKTDEGINITSEKKEELDKQIKNLADFKEKIKKVSTTELLDTIFAGASAVGASDIHLEPEEADLKIRYRIDGVLQDIAKLPLAVHKSIISRIKFFAKLKIDVNSNPQDGRFDARAGNEPIDVRVSTLPSAYGESVVMRLLYHNKEFLTLEKLGFAPDYLEIIKDASSKPHGIIFNTGPTGSGKTTTLYAVLTQLNKPGVKIITLEDPIEYRIAGVEQTQVNTDKQYTFASGLRSILRQDPDVVMVGEVRDTETAEIAVNAALTGHLVLSTLHTNNAPAAIPRLMQMGVKPYLLGGSINLIIAQRLVRTICKNCAGKGCDVCNHTGYKGRTTIAELMVPTPEIEILIKNQSTLSEFIAAAKKGGMRSMEEDGMLKVAQGITTREEVLRVTRE